MLTFTLLVVLTALPFAGKHVALSWLMKNGITEAHIDNVDLNLFTGSLAVEGVHLRSQSGETTSLTRCSVNLAMTELVKNRIRIESLHLEGLDLAITQGKQITIGGIKLPSEAPPPEPASPIKAENPWKIGIDALSIQKSTMAVTIPDLTLHLELTDASLTHLHAWTPEEEARLEIKGSLNTSPLLISLDLTPFAKTLAVRGGIQLKPFSLAPFHRMATPHLSDLTGDLSIDTRLAFTHTPGTGTTLSQTGTLALHNAGGKVKSQGVTLNDLDLTWLGDLWATLDAENALTDLRSLGRLANSELNAMMTKPGLHLRHQGVIWNGEMRVQPKREDGLTARGNLSVNQALATDTDSRDELAALSRLFIYDLKANGLKNIRTPHIFLKGVKALPPLAEIGSLDLTGIALNNLRDLSADTLIIGNVATALERDPEGHLTFLKSLTALMPPQPKETEAPFSQVDSPAEPPPPPDEPPAFTLKINTLRIFGNKFFHFTDRSVTPSFNKGVTLKRFELLNIDSSKPEQDLPLSLQATLSTHEALSITGTVRPFSADVTAHLNAAITHINLAPLSPYSSQALGYLIDTGNVSAVSKIDINAGVLDVTNQLTLRNLKLVADDEETIDQVMKNLTLPLDYALSILEDDHGTIHLALPVTGDIRNPDISLNSIIQKAMTKAITKASVSYLSFLLQPYGALLMVADKAGELMTEIHLDPVSFKLGSPTPSSAGLAYLKVVADLMKKKEVLNLTVCANAVIEDLTLEEETTEGNTHPLLKNEKTPLPQVDKTLYLELARQRADSIHDILVQHGINPARIHLCTPRFTVSKQEKPEATLTL